MEGVNNFQKNERAEVSSMPDSCDEKIDASATSGNVIEENRNPLNANLALRKLMTKMPPLRMEQRLKILERMGQGPETETTDPELTPFFDEITQIEEAYGRDAVQIMARLYGIGRE